jgi:hypothetical protein
VIPQRVVLVVVALAVVLAPRPRAQQPPALPDVLERVGKYVETYAGKMSGVSLEERLLLIETSQSFMRVPKRIAADVVFVKFDDLLMGLRDPYSIDTRPVRERRPDAQPRLVQVLVDPTPANWETAQRHVREFAHLLQHNVVVWYSDPIMAVQFAESANQRKLTYELEDAKTINGVRTLGLEFKEALDGPRILSSVPGNAISSGRLWIDPATGAIHMTELWVQSDNDIVRVQVEFVPDAKLDLLLPRKATHTFQWREWGNRIDNPVGTTPMKISFESSAEYLNPRYTPIDLRAR